MKKREREKEKERRARRKKREDERENEEREMKRGDFFQKKKNVSGPSNPPEELAQNVSKKKKSDELFLFLQKCRIWPFLNYLHDSNSIFGPRELNQNGFSGARYGQQKRSISEVMSDHSLSS